MSTRLPDRKDKACIMIDPSQGRHDRNMNDCPEAWTHDDKGNFSSNIKQLIAAALPHTRCNYFGDPALEHQQAQREGYYHARWFDKNSQMLNRIGLDDQLRNHIVKVRQCHRDYRAKLTPTGTSYVGCSRRQIGTHFANGRRTTGRMGHCSTRWSARRRGTRGCRRTGRTGRMVGLILIGRGRSLC